MAKTYTEVKLDPAVQVIFSRICTDAGPLDWIGRLDAQTVLDTGEVHRRIERNDLMERLTVAQRTQIKTALDTIVQRLATFLEVDPA